MAGGLRRYRWGLVGAGAVAVVGALLAVGAYPAPEGRYARAQYDRVRLGMTPADVEAVLGPPSDGAGPQGDWRWDAEEGLAPAPANQRWWADGRAAIGVSYDGDKRVAWKARFIGPAPGFGDRLRGRLGF